MVNEIILYYDARSKKHQIISDYYLKSMLHKICSWHCVIKKCTKHRILESFVTDLHQYHQVHKHLFVHEISLRETANITWHVQPAGHGDFHVTALHYADLLLANNRDHAAVLYKNTILLRWMDPCSCCTNKQCARYCLCAATYSHGIVHWKRQPHNTDPASLPQQCDFL